MRSGKKDTVKEYDGEMTYNAVMKAIQSGDKSAKTALAILKLKGLGGTEIDEKGAIELLKVRGRHRDLTAAWVFGLCCEFGVGVKQDINKVKKLQEI